MLLYMKPLIDRAAAAQMLDWAAQSVGRIAVDEPTLIAQCTVLRLLGSFDPLQAQRLIDRMEVGRGSARTQTGDLQVALLMAGLAQGHLGHSPVQARSLLYEAIGFAKDKAGAPGLKVRVAGVIAAALTWLDPKQAERQRKQAVDLLGEVPAGPGFDRSARLLAPQFGLSDPKWAAELIGAIGEPADAVRTWVRLADGLITARSPQATAALAEANRLLASVEDERWREIRRVDIGVRLAALDYRQAQPFGAATNPDRSKLHSARIHAALYQPARWASGAEAMQHLAFAKAEAEQEPAAVDRARALVAVAGIYADFDGQTAYGLFTEANRAMGDVTDAFERAYAYCHLAMCGLGATPDDDWNAGRDE